MRHQPFPAALSACQRLILRQVSHPYGLQPSGDQERSCYKRTIIAHRAGLPLLLDFGHHHHSLLPSQRLWDHFTGAPASRHPWAHQHRGLFPYLPLATPEKTERDGEGTLSGRNSFCSLRDFILILSSILRYDMAMS